MKKLILLLIVILPLSQSWAQSAIKDAEKLKDLRVGSRRLESNRDVIEIPDIDEVYQILKYYVPKNDNTDKVKIRLAFKGNPFIDFAAGSDSRGLPGSTSLISLTTPFDIGNLDVTNIANGIAQFMIDRAKQELTVAFFSKFKNFADNNPEFKILFPKTTDNLNNLLSYKYPEMLPALRVGFLEDLKSLTTNLDGVLELPRYQKLLQHFPEVRVAIRSLRLVQQLALGSAQPADIITQFAGFPEWQEANTSQQFSNFGSSVRLAALISNSLLNLPEDDYRWVPLTELNQLIKDPDMFQIYLGLIWQQSKTNNIFWYDGNQQYSFCDALVRQRGNLFLFQNKLTKFIELASEVSNRLDTLAYRKNNDQAPTKEDYYNYINTAINITEYSFSIAQIFNDHLDISPYVFVARKADDLYLHLCKEQYTQALVNAVDFLQGVSDILVKEKERLDKTSASTLNADPLLAAKAAALHDPKDLNHLINVIAQITKYGVFMANMVEAKTPEEVASVLDNAVLPVGSSSIKKNTDFNIAVQSYLGAYGRFHRLDHPTNTAWSDKFGVSAPIGISLSHGFGKAGSLSLFLPLFDLGAVVDYRLKKDSVADANGNTTAEVQKNYKIRLGQIVSPGAYVMYGFGGNIPLSLGIGGQYGPGLAKIDGTGATSVVNPQWRWCVIFGVDIPFFNLQNWNKKYKLN